MQQTARDILLFGDQADAPVPMIRRVVEKGRQSKNLESFLQGAIDNVQIEVAKLTPAERETVGSFQSVQDLTLPLLNDTDRYGIARMVVVFIARIGELILHAESNPTLLSGTTPVVCLGICGGLLPAAVAAVATNVSQLVQVGSYLAGINCRVAAAISRRSVQIEDDTAGSWAFSALGGVVPQLPSILDKFHREQAIPRHRRAYIAVSTPTWATVFGPPSVLTKLFETSETLRTSETQLIPAFGAVHAGHLAAPDYADLIPDHALLSKPVKPNFKLISGSKYMPYPATTLAQLLPQTMADIFQNSTNPSRVFEVGSSFLQKPSSINKAEISLYMLGATSYLILLRRHLQTLNFPVSLKTSPPSPGPLPTLRSGSQSVAIVGMSGKFPSLSPTSSDDLDTLFDTVLLRGIELHRPIPNTRFDPDSYLDPSAKSPWSITTPFGAFLENPGKFDYKFFNVSPREAMQMDPGQRLLMHAVYEALEDAGVTNDGTLATDPRRIGTYVGDASDDWRELQMVQPSGVDKYTLQGTQRSFTPGRINHHFRWSGATFSVDSACGSSASAVGLAYRGLVERDIDTAIAGGSNIIATPFWQSVLSKGGFLSPTGGSKTFREDADGYCRGEAIGAVVMKRLEDAVRDGDNIVAVIRGYARNHSGEAVSITRPEVGAQERVYRTLLHQTGLTAADISYVEMHGTGTTAGDEAELTSVGNVLARKGERDAGEKLLVGAIKANLGHSEAASGISSIMKAAMMFRKGVVPPQPGIPAKLAKYAALENSEIYIPGEVVPYTRESLGGKKRTLMVSNFDAAGGNSCFILEEPPAPFGGKDKGSDPRSHHVVTVSGHSPVSLQGNKERLLEFLKTGEQEVNLANLAYTTTARRMHHSFRAAFAGTTVQDIVDGLSKDLAKASTGVAKALVGSQKSSKVVFTFTGQGAHYAGMGSSLYKASPAFRTSIATLQRICASHGFPAFTHIIANPESAVDKATTAQVHLALVALQIALVDLYATWGVTPDVVLGHSIGEYAALYAAGILSATDALYLIGKRALLVQETCESDTHGMLSISASPEQVASILSDKTIASMSEVACHNSPGMMVLSGKRDKLQHVETVLQEQKIKTKILDVKFAMHSSQMDGVLPGLKKAAEGVRFAKSPKEGVRLISTLLGREIQKSEVGPEYLVRHTREPVKFEQAVQHVVDKGLIDPATAVWLEIGPAPVCLGLARANPAAELSSDRALASLKKGEDDWKAVTAVLATWYKSGRTVRWREFHGDFVTSHQVSMVYGMPKYAWETRDFWMPYTHHTAFAGGETNMLKPAEISTCLHTLVSKDENSATFTTSLTQSSLAKMISGHKLSGITVCPAGVFSDMALTAARYLLTNGASISPDASYPRLSVLDTQIDHPIVPKPDIEQVMQTSITRTSHNTFTVNISEASNPSVITTKCTVVMQNPTAFINDKQARLSTILPRIHSLRQSASMGQVNRFQQNMFYKLFNNVMDYTSLYFGVREAIVSEDFATALATVALPVSNLTPPDPDLAGSTTLSPYWMDALGHLAGFLLNGNPFPSTLSPSGKQQDFVYIGTQMERMEVNARDFKHGVKYLSYAHVEPEDKNKGDVWIGNVYLLDERAEQIVGFYEGLRFRRMTRGTLHRILGAPPPAAASVPKSTGVGVNGHQTEHVPAPATASVVKAKVNGTHPIFAAPVVKQKSIYSVLVEKLIDETGMEESDLSPSTFFSEIGVESLMSLSILAAVKADTGVELNAAFLMEFPTLEDAQRELRKYEAARNPSPQSQLEQELPEPSTNGHSTPNNETTTPADGYSTPASSVADAAEDTTPVRECNTILMQGPPFIAPSSPNTTFSPPLFLIADGAGSGAAYIHLPKISATQTVYAIESPYVSDPQNFLPSSAPFPILVQSYLNAIRSKQPHGPYILGGWSAGGVFSYEVARQLLNSGERVLSLIIIDITAPRIEDATKFLPPTMEIIDKIGMLSGIERNFETAQQTEREKKEEERLKRHMLATVTVFSQLDAAGMKMDDGKKPDVTWVVWARKDVLPKSVLDGDEMKGLGTWFYPTSHVEVGDYGWADLLGYAAGDKLRIRQIEGDHFSIMTVPEVNQLGDILKEAVEATQSL
ncbi:hypothetical protein V8F06_007822 [Rhypophila decipiens]